MAYYYDTNALRQIEANDSEFNKAQKADNLHNINTNIALNGAPAQQTVPQQQSVPQPQAQPAVAQQPQVPQATPQTDTAWYLKENNMPTKVTQMVAQGSQPTFNAQAATNAAILDLMKKGYSQDEAAQMLSPYIMQWKERETQQKKAQADDLMTRMGNMEFGSKDYYNAALQMYQLDPERGQMLLRGAVSPKDMWVRENRLADLADQRAYQAMYGGGRGGRGGGGGGRSGGGGGGGRRGRPAAQFGGVTTTQYNMMKNIQGRLDKQIQALIAAGKDVPASLKQKAMAIDNALERVELSAAGLLGDYVDNGGGGVLTPGMTREQMANGIQNVIWDDGLKAGGPSEDAIEYLLGKLPKGATREKIKSVSDALYNAAGDAEDADAALLGGDAPLQVRQQLYAEGMNEAARRKYKIDLDGTIYGASEEFKNKYPNLKYGGGSDYYKGLLAEYGEDDEENA